jgi:type VI secretion system secreted protein VgrG
MTTPDETPAGFSLHVDDAEPFADLRIHRVEYIDELNQPFSLTIGLTTTDPGVDPRSLLGREATLTLEGEPWLGEIRGLVRACRQRTALGLAREASAYELDVAPPLWLLSRRRARRIHQRATVLDVVAKTLAGAEVTAPTARVGRVLPEREYVVQYDETDLAFVRRQLSDHHLVAFFDHAKGGAWTVTDALASASGLVPAPLVYRSDTGLVPEGPHALGISTRTELGVAKASLRDYDFEHPLLARAEPYGLEGTAGDPAALPREKGSLEDFRVGRFASEREGADLAERDRVRADGPSETLSWVTSFAMYAGTRFTLRDHPRGDLGDDFVVVGTRFSVDDGLVLDGEAPRKPGRRAVCHCVPAARAHFAPSVPRPRVSSTEIAFVVGDGAEGSVDVDEHGRVKIELPWDRRDLRRGNPTRWVRVSQAWAGANRGLVTLPRIGDEVLIAYLGGDPDEPVVVGRVHNALSRTPLDLPDPDRTVSVWRSRTIGGDGYNEILMDDAPGKERLWLRAERDHQLQVNRSSKVDIDGDARMSIGGDASLRVQNDLRVRSASFEQETGPLEVRSTSTKLVARDEFAVEADTIRLSAASRVEIRCGGTSLVLTEGGATLSGGKVTIEGGQIEIKADGTVDVDGALITLN